MIRLRGEINRLLFINFRYGSDFIDFKFFKMHRHALWNIRCTDMYKKSRNCFQILNRCCNGFPHSKARKYFRNIFSAIFILPGRQHLSPPLYVTWFSIFRKKKGRKKWNHISLDWSLLCSSCDEECRISRGKIWSSTAAVSPT